MKSYPSIEHTVITGQPVYVFDKLDGQNFRAKWTRKAKKFVKFGSRNVLVDSTHPAAQLIVQTYEPALNDIFLRERYQEAVAFFEYHGPNSFAGFHSEEDVNQGLMKVTLFDVNVHKQGILFPGEFTRLFKHVETPKLLHVGSFNEEVKQLVETGTLAGMTFEGVVCKTQYPLKKGYPPTMFKWKSAGWIEKVKQFANGDKELEEKLT